MKKTLLMVFVLMSGATSLRAQDLLIDFNSTTAGQDNGPHNLVGFQPYNADHEADPNNVAHSQFDTKTYAAFGTTVALTPVWPNTTAKEVQQMIDRTAGFDATWTDVGIGIDGVTDWIGIDTRTGNGGNGNWDGVTGTPTYMQLVLSGLPAGPYNWTSFHHDTEHVHGDFAVWVSTDGGGNFAQYPDGYMSDGTAAGTPDSTVDGGQAALVADVGGMAVAGSIYGMSFNADGLNDVVVQFAPYSGRLGNAVHNQLWGVNGFQLSLVPEPSSVGLMLLGGLLFLRRRPL